jgi:hypothetical protein
MTSNYNDKKRHHIGRDDVAKLECGSEVLVLTDPERIAVDLWYPCCGGNIDTIEVELVDVRAADGIRISYDFERDGYSISQSDNADVETWAEVAFIQAWARGEPDNDW